MRIAALDPIFHTYQQLNNYNRECNCQVASVSEQSKANDHIPFEISLCICISTSHPYIDSTTVLSM